MEEKFGEFFQDENYLKVKNSLFNYRNRKKEVKDAFFKWNKESNNLLDIGSGVSPVSPIPEKTLFIDLSKEGIELLKKQGLNSEVGSITNIQKKDESFDMIFCSEVLEHIEDYKKAIREILRVSKIKGKVIITVPVHEKYWHGDDEFVEHYRRFNPKELRSDLEKAGFRILEEKPIGSFIERYLTWTIVKLFRSSQNKPISNYKMPLILFVNKILYLIVRGSLKFNSKKNTSIMMYVCERVN